MLVRIARIFAVPRELKTRTVSPGLSFKRPPRMLLATLPSLSSRGRVRHPEDRCPVHFCNFTWIARRHRFGRNADSQAW
jgi:hypothetical protein